MKHLVCLIATFFILVSSASARDSSNVSSNENGRIAARVLTDVGKSITYLGGSVVYCSAAYIAMMKYDSRVDNAYGVGVILGIAGLAYGGIAALCGLPFWIPSEIVLRTNGQSPYSYSDEKKKGFGVLLDVGITFGDMIAPKLALGYNFSQHVFLGMGASYNIFLTRTEKTKDILPVYLKSRFVIGSYLVSPYVDLDLGADALDGSFYYSTGMGVRYRLSQKQNALLGGFYAEACRNYSTMGFRLSYSF